MTESAEAAAALSAGLCWIASYPKSGSTWFRALLSNLLANRDMPLAINDLATDGIASARGWLDELLGFDTADLPPDALPDLRRAAHRWASHEAGRGSRRTYRKIHDALMLPGMPAPLIADGGRQAAIYLLRNPLDVAVSYAHHLQQDLDRIIGHMGSPNHRLQPGPGWQRQVPQRLGTWSQHVESWADAPGLRRLVLRYEDLLDNPHRSFAAAAAFLGLPAEPTQIDRAVRFSSFEVLAGQERAGGFRESQTPGHPFFRHGKSGDWRRRLTAGQVARLLNDHRRVMARFGYLDAQGQPL